MNIFLTIDVEHSIGGAFENPSRHPVGNDKRIFCRIQGKEYGIPLIMDIADAHGLPLTFFVEVLNKHHFGEAESRSVCEYILSRGHDVQLHLHPNFLNFMTDRPSARHFRDNMSSYDLAHQIDIIAEGKELLTRYCGHPPIAFRAGNYAADIHTLEALSANGMRYDSSYNAAFAAHCKKISSGLLNDLSEINGIMELPITVFREHLPIIKERFKPMDINGVSLREMKHLLRVAHDSRSIGHATIILHSFSFLHAKDIQYTHCRIRKNVIARFEGLCRYLAENRHFFQCCSFRSFAMHQECSIPQRETHPVLTMPSLYSMCRIIEQVLG